MLPLPSDAYVMVPGFALATLTSSGTLRAATDGCTTSTSGFSVQIEIGANPFSASYGSFVYIYGLMLMVEILV